MPQHRAHQGRLSGCRHPVLGLALALLTAGLLFAGGVLGTTAHGAEPLVCRFEAGRDGFGGPATIAAGQGVKNSACLRFQNTTNDWESIARLFVLPQHDLAKASFQVRPTQLEKLTVRFVDATGQTFQNVHDLKADVWQTIEITDLTQGQAWGGAGDKVWHGPCERFELLIEERGGVALIDDVVFTYHDAIAPAAAALGARLAAAQKIEIASFDTHLDEFDGGTLARRTDGAAHGAGYARLSNADEDFTEMTRSLTLPRDFVRFAFRARSKNLQTVTIRLTDATGQAFLHRLPLPTDDAWHAFSITHFADAAQSYGGADDKQWHPPCRDVAFIVEQKQAELDLDAVEAWLDRERVATDLAWTMTQASHVYLTDQPLLIPFETRGDAVEFRITDFWQREVLTTTVKPKNGQGVLAPPVRNGYFFVRARVLEAGRELKTGYTAYAVLPPYRLRNAADSPFGAATHFAQGVTPRILPVLKTAGIGMIRDELYWEDVERTQGRYEFSARFQSYMQAVRDSGLAPLLIMDFANPLYDEGLTPHTDAGCTAFGKYGAAIKSEFGPQVRWLEVWNEYNGTWCEGPAAADRPKSHVKLLKHAYAEIKRKDPAVQVLGGAAVLLPRPYFEGIFEQGGLAYMDGLVIHPYRGRPEGVDQEVEELRGLMRKYNGGVEKDIWVTETGLQAETEFEWEAGLGLYERGRQEAARYLPRQYALLLKAGCKRIFWYVANDSDVFKTMGLLRQERDVAGMGPLVVTPNYVAYATLIRQLDGRTFRAREGYVPYSRAYCLRFGATEKPSPDDVRLLWATSPSAFDLHATGPVTITDLVGEAKQLTPTRGIVRLPVGIDTVYVRGPVTKVEAVPEADECLAATDDDFSAVQGTKGWYYGYRQGRKGPFQELKWMKTEWDYRWKSDQFAYLHQSKDGGEPEGTAAAPYYLDRRWKSPVAGELTLVGELGSWDAQSDGLDFHIEVDGKAVYAKTVKGGEMTPLNVLITVRIGSLVDFLVGPNQATSYDSCHWQVQVRRKK